MSDPPECIATWLPLPLMGRGRDGVLSFGETCVMGSARPHSFFPLVSMPPPPSPPHEGEGGRSTAELLR